MRHGIFASMAALLAGAGFAVAQPLPTPERGLGSSLAGTANPLPGTATVAYGTVADGGQMPAAQAVQPAAPGYPIPGQPLWSIPEVPEKGARGDSDDGACYGPGPAPYRLWADVEYLLYWVKPGLLPGPLVTGGSPSSFGVLGQPGTTVLFGGNLDYDVHSGGRVTVGGWLDNEGYAGVEVSLFALEERSTGLTAGSDATGTPLLGLPVVNALTGQEAVNLVAFPGALTGNVNVHATEQLYGAEANFVGSLYRSKWLVADMLIGFRYIGLEEELGISSATTVLPGGVAAFNGAAVSAPNGVAVSDHFETRNDFYGGQVGARTQLRWNRLFLNLEGKLAVGSAHETVNIGGSTSLVTPAGSTTLPGGILAVASNSGIHSHDEFTFVPEGSVKLGVHVTSYVSAYVGYTFLYWYDVARAGDQIDRVVNPSLVPSNLSFGSGVGPVRPVGGVKGTDFWAQGVNFGLEIRY